MSHPLPEKSSHVLGHRYLLHPFIAEACLSHQKRGDTFHPLNLYTAVYLPEMEVFKG